MTKISIVTISDGNTKALKKTLNSIDNQNYKNFKNLIITKKNLKNLDKKYKKKNRFFYYRKNSSIYEAMNYGLTKSVNNFLIFLNSGDQFMSKSSLKKISTSTNNFKLKSCMMLVSILKNEKDYYIPKKKLFFSNNFLTHSSFIRPPAKSDDGYDTKNKITADGRWMKSNIKKFGIKKIYSPITIFNLGGVSNLPSKNSLIIKANNGIIVILKELIKIFLLKTVGKNTFYKIIYCYKYNRVNYKTIYKLL